MIILGIDPGTRRVGFGVIKKERSVLSLLDAGILPIQSRDDCGALYEIKQGLSLLIKKWRPDASAVEKLYFSKNQKTALQVAQARGVILLTLQEHSQKIYEYTPNEVKLHFSGYGNTDKRGIAKMVQLTFNIPALRMVDDATDAIAIAVCAAGNVKLR